MRDFKETLKNCLREEPPFCSSVCPFGLDVRDLISRLQRGSFNSAYRLFQNTVGFPAIVAQICHRPCAAACIRQEKDEAVLLGKLEQAAVAYAANRQPNQYQLPAKNKKIAIIGAGPDGLACALRLTARKYEVVLYEKSNRIGGCLWDLLPPEQFLPDRKGRAVGGETAVGQLYRRAARADRTVENNGGGAIGLQNAAVEVEEAGIG